MCFLPSSKSLTSWAQKLRQNQPKRINAEEVCVNSMHENEQAKKLPLENVSIFLFYDVYLILFLSLVFFQCSARAFILSFKHLSSGVPVYMFEVNMVRVYFLDHSILPHMAILACCICCLIFALIYLNGKCSFFIEIIITFSIKASGHANLLCHIIFGRTFDFS